MGDNAANDGEFRKKIWEGTIPIVFNLASNEVTTLEKPNPFFVSFKIII
jgi:hypothetical protein